jgi:threonine synthase
LAGLFRAKELGLMDRAELAVLDATAHSLKFMGFQEMYFEDRFPPEYGIQTKEDLRNQPLSVLSPEDKDRLSEQDFVAQAAQEIVQHLRLG